MLIETFFNQVVKCSTQEQCCMQHLLLCRRQLLVYTPITISRKDLSDTCSQIFDENELLILQKKHQVLAEIPKHT